MKNLTLLIVTDYSKLHSDSRLDSQRILHSGGRGESTPIYELYRYVLQNSVRFLKFSVLKYGSFFKLLLLCSRCGPWTG